MDRWDISSADRPAYVISHFTTACGFIGLMDATPKKGDVLVLASGSHAPMVLRPAEGSCWRFQGFAWVD